MVLKVQKILKSPQHWISDRSSSDQKKTWSSTCFLCSGPLHTAAEIPTLKPPYIYIYSNGKDRQSSQSHQFGSVQLMMFAAGFCFSKLLLLCVCSTFATIDPSKSLLLCVCSTFATIDPQTGFSKKLHLCSQTWTRRDSLITQGTLGWIRWQQAMVRHIYSMPWILGQEKYQISAGNLAVPHQLR